MKHRFTEAFIGCVIILLCAAGIMYLLMRGDSKEKSDEEYLNEDVDFVCLVYGDDYNMGELRTERVTSLNTEFLLRDNDYVYLIMFDLSGTGNITSDDAYRLVKLADENTNFNFFYVGSEAMTSFQEARGQMTTIVPGNLVMGYCYERVRRVGSVGIWTQEDMNDPTMNPSIAIPKRIIPIMAMFVRANEVKN